MYGDDDGLVLLDTDVETCDCTASFVCDVLRSHTVGSSLLRRPLSHSTHLIVILADSVISHKYLGKCIGGRAGADAISMG